MGHLRSCRGHDDAVDLELSRPLPRLLLQVHLGDVVLRERNLKMCSWITFWNKELTLLSTERGGSSLARF